MRSPSGVDEAAHLMGQHKLNANLKLLNLNKVAIT